MKRYRLAPELTRAGRRLLGERPGPGLSRHGHAGARRSEVAAWTWHVDEISFFRGVGAIAGWATSTTGPLRAVAVLRPDGQVLARTDEFDPSPDVAAVWGPDAACCRFRLRFETDDPVLVREAGLRLLGDDGPAFVATGLVQPAMDADPYQRLFQTFIAEIRRRPPGAVIEIGSRNRSGNVRRALVEPHDYVGVDIVAGDNVDIVADAHALSGALGRRSFDAALSISTFEHLAMPWKAVVELNHVLRDDALVFVSSHQAFPLHETPWDFWRFSESAWRALFNASTGFEIIELALGEPASIVPHLLHPVTTTLELQPAYLGSAVLARKTGPTDLRWDVPTEVATLDTRYPA